jgi:GNAT superfamily N-acetyltransferase
VASSQDFQAFLEFPSRLHHVERLWIPPPPDLYSHLLSREENPYFEHADAEYLLAERDGEVVGHVITHIDHVLNERKQNRWGLFGFFEAQDDQQVANALFDAAAEWLRERGRDTMVGPLQFSAREDPGLLIDGNDRPPVILQPWHPNYYRRLLEGSGLRKAIDVVWRELELDKVPEPLLAQASKWADTVRTRYGVTIRPPREGDVAADLERVFRFVPPIFESHWAYVPLSERELEAALGFATRFLGPGTRMAEREGELIGASMMMPDYNQALAHENGEVTRTSKKIDQARVMMMAVDSAHRHLGITPALCHAHIDSAREQGIGRFVIGWSLEDNQQMNSVMARLDLPVARRHRIYEKDLSAPSSPARGEPAASE